MSRSPFFAATAAIALATLVDTAAAAGEPVSRDALFQTAEAHYAVVEVEEAARDWESFARTGLDDARSPEALKRAMAARILLGQDSAAAADAADIQRAWSRKYPAFVADAELTLGRSRADQGAWDDAIASLVQATRTLAPGEAIEVQAEIGTLLGRAYAALGRTREAITAHRRVVNLAAPGKVPGKRGAFAWSPPARDALAESRFFFAEQARARAEAVKLAPYRGVLDRKGIFKYLSVVAAPWLARRTEANEEAMRAYQSVLGIEVPAPPPRRSSESSAGGDPNAPTAAWGRDDSLGLDEGEPPSIRWAIAAADRVGSMWADHVYTLRTMPVPAAWQHFTDVGEAYQMMLDPAEAPYEQNAKHAFAYCRELSRRHRIFDEHTRSCEAWFAKYRRSELIAFDEIFPTATWAAPTLLPAPMHHDP